MARIVPNARVGLKDLARIAKVWPVQNPGLNRLVQNVDDLVSQEGFEEVGLTVNRLTIEYSAYYTVQKPELEYGDPPPLLVALHGFGQSSKSFMRDFSFLRDRNLLIAAPQAPNQFYWRRSGAKVGFAWMTRFMKDNTLKDLMAYLARFMTDITAKYTFDSQRVFLLGFSQGCALSFRFAASGGVQPAGLIACGGDLPQDVREGLDSLAHFPVLIVHGEKDKSVGIERAKEGQEVLEKHGFDVDTQYFDGDHGLPREQVEAIAQWISVRT